MLPQMLLSIVLVIVITIFISNRVQGLLLSYKCLIHCIVSLLCEKWSIHIATPLRISALCTKYYGHMCMLSNVLDPSFSWNIVYLFGLKPCLLIVQLIQRKQYNIINYVPFSRKRNTSCLLYHIAIKLHTNTHTRTHTHTHTYIYIYSIW